MGDPCPSKSEEEEVRLMPRYEYKVIHTGRDVETELNSLGKEGWKVVGVTTKKQLFIAPPQAIILMRVFEEVAQVHAAPALAETRPR
jgi:hypothetical protein